MECKIIFHVSLFIVAINYCLAVSSHTEFLAHVNSEHHSAHPTIHDALKTHVTVPLQAVFESRLEKIYNAFQLLNETLVKRTEELEECRQHEELIYELQVLKNVTTNIQEQLSRPSSELHSCLSELHRLKNQEPLCNCTTDETENKPNA